MILICLDMTFPRCIRPWHPRCLIWWSLYGRWRVWNSWPKDWWRRCKSPWMKQNGWSPWSTGRGQRVVVLHQLDMLMELLKLSTTYHNIYIYYIYIYTVYVSCYITIWCTVDTQVHTGCVTLCRMRSTIVCRVAGSSIQDPEPSQEPTSDIPHKPQRTMPEEV